MINGFFYGVLTFSLIYKMRKCLMKEDWKMIKGIKESFIDLQRDIWGDEIRHLQWKNKKSKNKSGQNRVQYWERVKVELFCTCPCRTEVSDGNMWRSGAGLGAGPRTGSGWRNALFAFKGLDKLWELICTENHQWRRAAERVKIYISVLSVPLVRTTLTLLLFACEVWLCCVFLSVVVTGIRSVWGPYGPVTDTGYSRRLKLPRTGN